MAQKRRVFSKRNNKRNDRPSYVRPEPAAPYVPKPVVTYGKPTMLLEDTLRNTFEFKAGTWVPFAMSIAECRRDCLVKELSQKVNQMTRYEVRFPV